mgnify:CR=1 FL=1
MGKSVHVLYPKTQQQVAAKAAIFLQDASNYHYVAFHQSIQSYNSVTPLPH